MCDLTHLCETLEEFAELMSERARINIKEQLRSISMAVTPQQLDDLFSDMDDHVSDFKGWGQRTRNQRNHWVKVMLEKVNEVIVDTCFPLELVCWNDALKIFGGARILEEFWTEEEDTSTYKTSLDAMQYFMDDFDLDPRTLSEWKQLVSRFSQIPFSTRS